MSSTVTTEKPAVFMIADIVATTAGRELTVVPSGAVTRAIDGFIGAAREGEAHGRSLPDRVGASVMAGLFTAGVVGGGAFVYDGSVGSAALLACAAGATAALGHFARGYAKAKALRARLHALVPVEPTALTASPVQRLILAELGKRCAASTREALPSAAWTKRLTVTLEGTEAGAAVVAAACEALFERGSAAPSRNLTQSFETLLYAIENCPKDDLPVLAHLVQGVFTRANLDPVEPNTAAWFRRMPILEALEGRRFRFSDYVKTESMHPGSKEAECVDLALAKVDYGIKRERAAGSTCPGVWLSARDVPEALRMAAAVEARGFRVSIDDDPIWENGHVSVVAYEDGKQPPCGMHDDLGFYRH